MGTQAPPVADTSLMRDVVEQVGLRIVGQNYLIERLVISILTGGHVLLEGVPGLAKTLAVSTLAETISTKFQRIQFTPDLLPLTYSEHRSTISRAASSASRKGRSSPTSFSPTR